MESIIPEPVVLEFHSPIQTSLPPPAVPLWALACPSASPPLSNAAAVKQSKSRRFLLPCAEQHSSPYSQGHAQDPLVCNEGDARWDSERHLCIPGPRDQQHPCQP